MQETEIPGDNLKCVDIVDDELSVLTGLSRLLRASGYCCRTFSSGAEYFAAVPPASPVACLLLDINMPEMNGVEIQEQLMQMKEDDTPTVFLSACSDVATVVTTMRRGAVNFLQKPFTPEQLLAAVEEALALAHRVHEENMLIQETAQRFALLTVREREVFGLVVEGLLNKQIASRLQIAEKTVKIHRARVMSKMRVASVAALVRQAEQLKVRHQPETEIGAST